MKVIQKVLIVLLVYILVILSVLFVFSSKLSNDEYEVISEVYIEMHLRQNNIKNDFYINNLLKILDRNIILEELKSDGLYYLVNQTTNAFDMILKGYKSDYIVGYLDRSNINFDAFNKTEYLTNIQELNYFFFNNYDESDENLNVYISYFDSIVSEAEKEINQVKVVRILYIIGIFISFLIINILWNLVYIKKKLKNYKEKKKVVEGT